MSKTYLKCSAKMKPGRFGDRLLLGVKAEDLIAFANTHKNERGYVNFVISERQTPGQYGDTHSVALDDYQPQSRQSSDSYNSGGHDDIAF